MTNKLFWVDRFTNRHGVPVYVRNDGAKFLCVEDYFDVDGKTQIKTRFVKTKEHDIPLLHNVECPQD